MIIENKAIVKNNDKLSKMLQIYNLRHMQKNGTPLCFSFLVTNRCFLKCKHCFYYETIGKNDYKENQKELSIDEYHKLSKSMSWFLYGIFCGGEPFLRDDLHEIIQIFRTNNEMPWCDSATNGQMSDSIIKQVELICRQDKHKTYSLSFSLDGFEDEHDEIRGKGTYRRAMDTLQDCLKLRTIYNNLEINLCSTVNTINEHNLKDFFLWSIDQFHPNRITMLKIRQTPRDGVYLKNIDMNNYLDIKDMLSKATYDGLFGDVVDTRTFYNVKMNEYVYNTLINQSKSFVCYAGKHGAWVDFNGDVNVCEMFQHSTHENASLDIGNLRDYDMNFDELWNSEKANHVHKLVNHTCHCKTCTHETTGILPSLYFNE